MHRIRRFLAPVFCAALCLLLFCSCGDDGMPDPDKQGSWDATPQVLTAPTGSDVRGNDRVLVDLSGTAQGCVAVTYSGQNPKVRLQITPPSGNVYTYIVRTDGVAAVFPLSEGNGSYTINVFENTQGDRYAQAFGTTAEVTLENEFAPFLHTNQYVQYTTDSQAVALGSQLARSADTDLDVVENIYRYILKNISYDTDLAQKVQTEAGYLPDLDQVLKNKKGICFDYAALATAMLRTQRIPTQLVVGYSGQVYHAWINVHIDGVGWVNKIIEFKGDKWVRMDPTFDAAKKGLNQFVGNGDNYNPLYVY